MHRINKHAFGAEQPGDARPMLRKLAEVGRDKENLR
eukprot:COSAG04_NODE_3021_length_3268_cov_76.313979_4_plen_36_part_00